MGELALVQGKLEGILTLYTVYTVWIKQDYFIWFRFGEANWLVGGINFRDHYPWDKFEEQGP